MEEPIEKAYHSIHLAIGETRRHMEEAQAVHTKRFIETIDLLNHLQFALLQLQSIKPPPP